MAPTPGLGWRVGGASLAALRDRLVCDARLQSMLARLPIGGWIARRQSRALFDLCAGFVYSQVLVACVELGVCEALRPGPLSDSALADRIGLAPGPAARLFDAALGLGLIERRGAAIGLGLRGAALLGNPGVAAMVRHHALLYRDLADPVALLRAGAADTELGGFWAYAGAARPAALDDQAVSAYTRLMAASQPLVSAAILGCYPFRRHTLLLDVGGGDGSFISAVAAAAPALRCMLFDLPPVAARAQARFAAAGLGSRATACGGDARADSLPTGADIATLVRVLHDHDDAAALAILRGVRAALPPGGRLLVAEPMAETTGAAGVQAYFAIYLLCMGSGRPRSRAELTALIRAAGFSAVRERRSAQPLLTRVLIAEV